ncbi:MAG: hypothetical protein H6705_16775 [Myxococcales bacterium]|nr:hypothetical protein [Myxococcales bacterium]
MTPHIRSLLIVRETTFGSLDENGVPDRTIFDNAIAWDVDRASIVLAGEHPVGERDEVRAGFHGTPADPETITDGEGAPIQRWTGQLKVDATVRSLGSADPDDVAMMWALASGLTPLGYPTNAEVEVEGEVGAGQFEVADAVAAADLPTGGLVAYMPAGAGPAAFAQVVKKVSAEGDTTVDLSPLLPKATLEVGDVIRSAATFGSLPGRDLGQSLAVRADGHDWRGYGWGLRLLSAEFKSDGRRLRASMTFEIAIGQTAHDEVDATAANIAPRPARPAGSVVLHTLGAEVTLSDVIETAANAPRVGGRNVLCVDEWSVKITNTLAPVHCWGSVLGMEEMEVTERTCEVALTLARPTALVAGDFLNRRHRTLALSWGPAPGAGLVLPAAYLTADPNQRELGGDKVRQQLTYREGLPLTVTPLGGENADHLANSPILLGWGLTAES